MHWAMRKAAYTEPGKGTESNTKVGWCRSMASSAKRSSALPDVPSMGEAGFAGIDVLNYFAISAPAGTPAAVVDKLNAALRKMVTMPDVLARFKSDAVEPAVGTPAQLAAFIEADYRAWVSVVKTQNLKIE